MEKLINKILNDDYIVISTNAIKERILKYLTDKNIMNKISFKKEEDIIEDFFGKYNKKAFIELVLKNKLTPELAKIKLDNSLLVFDNNKINNKKIEELIEIKKNYSKYLEYNPIFNNLYKNKKILLINYSDIKSINNDLFEKALLKAKEIVKDIEFYDILNDSKAMISLYEFSNVKEEVRFIAKKVAALLSNGVNPNKIIINKPEDYYYSTIKEIFGLYHIDISLDNSSSLFSYDITKQTIKLLDEYPNSTIEEFCLILNEYLNRKTNNLINKIFNVLYKYIVFNNYTVKQLKEIIIYEFMNTMIYEEEYNNVIRFVNINDLFFDDDYYTFIIGFNQDVIPKSYKDEEYLTDNERKEFGLNTSLLKNLLNKKQLKKQIMSMSNLCISFSKISFNGEMNKSSFLDEIPNIVANDYVEDSYITYCKDLSYIDFVKKIEQYKKYGTNDDMLKVLNYNYGSILKEKYSNKYNGIDEIFFEEFINKGIVLSYTSLTAYNKCPFSFYLNYVLKIKREINDDFLFLGNLFHFVLKKMLLIPNANDYTNEFIEEYYKISNRKITSIDKVFNVIYEKDLNDLYQNIIEFNNNTIFKLKGLEEQYQKDIEFIFDMENKKIVLLGQIDKVLEAKIDDKLYAIVIDYKTGQQHFSWDEVLYGLNMQLLFYYYFLNSTKKYYFGGAFLQSVIPNNRFTYNSKKTEKELFRDETVLFGYMNDSMKIIKSIDCTYGNSRLVNGIKINKDGSYHSNFKKYLISDLEYEKLMIILNEKIREAISNILKGDFSIKPKVIYGKNLENNVGCEFCDYSEICYRKEEDSERLEKITLESWLREQNE